MNNEHRYFQNYNGLKNYGICCKKILMFTFLIHYQKLTLIISLSSK